MSQNGGETDQVTREALINPVQRRESSASRFLKHFTRPDRSNPAYHSEGKGLRKRRNWNSERQLAAPPQQVSSAPDPSASAVNSSGNNQPQRSHSFSEKPVDNHLPVSKVIFLLKTCSDKIKPNEHGVKTCFLIMHFSLVAAKFSLLRVTHD